MALALSLLTKIKHSDKDYECWKYSNGIAFNPSNNDTYTANINSNTMAEPSEQGIDNIYTNLFIWNDNSVYS